MTQKNEHSYRPHQLTTCAAGIANTGRECNTTGLQHTRTHTNSRTSAAHATHANVHTVHTHAAHNTHHTVIEETHRRKGTHVRTTDTNKHSPHAADKLTQHAAIRRHITHGPHMSQDTNIQGLPSPQNVQHDLTHASNTHSTEHIPWERTPHTRSDTKGIHPHGVTQVQGMKYTRRAHITNGQANKPRADKNSQSH